MDPDALGLYPAGRQVRERRVFRARSLMPCRTWPQRSPTVRRANHGSATASSRTAARSRRPTRGRRDVEGLDEREEGGGKGRSPPVRPAHECPVDLLPQGTGELEDSAEVRLLLRHRHQLRPRPRRRSTPRAPAAPSTPSPSPARNARRGSARLPAGRSGRREPSLSCALSSHPSGGVEIAIPAELERGVRPRRILGGGGRSRRRGPSDVRPRAHIAIPPPSITGDSRRVQERRTPASSCRSAAAGSRRVYIPPPRVVP